MISYIVEENHINSALSEILQYKQTEIMLFLKRLKKKAKYFVKRYGWGRESSFWLWQKASLAVEHAHAQSTYIRMRIHVGDAFVEGILLYNGVRVE